MINQTGGLPELLAYGRERNRLLQRIQTILEDDPRVGAAWLEGSFGRDEADEWSDLDLHIAVEDEHLTGYLDERLSLYERVGTPVLIQPEMPANAAPGATFQLVLYTGMFEVDWVIGPVGKAALPAAYLMLVERAPIPTEQFPPMTQDERREKADWWLVFFWAMAPIAVKYGGRSETRRAMCHIDLLSNAYIALWRLANQPGGPNPHVPRSNRVLEDDLDRQLPRVGEVIDPLVALNIIRALCTEVEMHHPTLANLGVPIPHAMPQEVSRLARLAEAAVRHNNRRSSKYR